MYQVRICTCPLYTYLCAFQILICGTQELTTETFTVLILCHLYYCIRIHSIPKRDQAMALYQESSPRFLHCAVQVEENCYLLGGHFSEKGQKSPALSLQVFHSINEKWETKTTTGDPPSGLLEGACTTASKSLYHFGGNDGNRFYNCLHCLESDTLQWRELHTSANRPMPKSGCGIVTYFEEELSPPSLIVFAGYGKPAPLTKPEARFIPDTTSKDGKGWTDEMHLFNLSKCM